MSSPAPIALFTYKRPHHTKRALEALQAISLAAQSDLYVFSDGPKHASERQLVRDVRQHLHSIRGFNTVHLVEQNENLGLAASIRAGVSKVLAQHERVIVLEDDIVVLPHFLRFMNEALSRYADESRLFSISGYTHPPRLMALPRTYDHDVYFVPRPSSWGWATWKDRWILIDWDVPSLSGFASQPQIQQQFNRGGEDLTPMLFDQAAGHIDSWAIVFAYTCFLHDRVSLYPARTLVQNIGFDESGTHTQHAHRFTHEHLDTDFGAGVRFPPEPFVDEKVLRAFRRVYSSRPIDRLWRRARRFLFDFGLLSVPYGQRTA